MERFFSSEREFKEWNEAMFKKHTNERCFTHPNPLLRFIEQQRIKYLLKYCRIAEKDKVLEVGCGSGYIMNIISKGELYGIDFSKTAITWAKQKLKNKLNIKHLSVQPGEHTNFPDNYFDVVYCSEVIEHVANPEKIFDEIYRISKPDARVIFTFPNEAMINICKQFVKKIGLYKIILKGIPEHMEDEWHVTEFSLKLFKHLALKNFSIRLTKPVPFFFVPLRYVALCSPKK